MNGPNDVFFFGIANQTDEETHQMIEHTEGIVASLDSEIASAMASRSKLVQRMHDIQQSIMSHQAQERMAIQAIVAEKELKLKRLQKEIIDAEAHHIVPKNLVSEGVDHRDRSTLEQLIYDRNDTVSILEKHRISLSPIRRLPPEVLGEIFLRCIPTGFCQPNLSEAPLLLTNVCSMWRSVALHTPDIWASISVTYCGAAVWPNEKLIKLWLDRSGPRPLSFSIVGGFVADDDIDAGPSAGPSLVLSTFLLHCARWRSIKFKFEQDSVVIDLPEHVMFPLLQTVHFDIPPSLYSEDIERLHRIIRAAPQLQSVAWINIFSPQINLPWEQLTCLDFTGSFFSPTDCLGTIKACQNLEVGSFRLFLRTSHSESARFTHYRLTVLNLVTGSPSYLRRFFEGITLPHLRELSVECDESAALGAFAMVWTQIPFTDMLRRSKPSLRKLEISGVAISSKDIVEVLWRVSSSLEALSLSHDRGCVDDVILSALTIHDEIEDLPPLCPNLTECSLWGGVLSSDGSLANMVESRWTPRGVKYPVAKLEVMMVMVHLAHYPKDTARLRNLEQTRICVSYQSEKDARNPGM